MNDMSNTLDISILPPPPPSLHTHPHKFYFISPVAVSADYR